MKSIYAYLLTFLTAISFSSCLPQGGDPKNQQPGGGLTTILFIPLMIIVFWLFFIRPQNRRQKQQKSFIQDLQKGDKVITIAGFHGTINKINEDGTVMLEISPGSYIKMEKTSISMEMTNQMRKAATTTTPDKK